MIHYYNGPLITKSKHRYDIDLLSKQWEEIKSKLNEDQWVHYDHGCHHETALQYSKHSNNKYIDSCIGVDSKGEYRRSFTYIKKMHDNKIKSETDFDTIVPEYKGTLFEQILKDHEGCRGRILGISSARNLAAHSGPSVFGRFHVALPPTNYCCGFWFPNYGKIYHMPADGHVYWFNSQATHTAINASENLKVRYHFAFTSAKMPPPGQKWAQNPYNWESIDSDPPDEIQRLDEDKTDTGVFTTTS